MARMFYVSIETDNAAFDESPAHELARILRKLADRMEHNGRPESHVNLFDLNGNECGSCIYDEGGA